MKLSNMTGVGPIASTACTRETFPSHDLARKAADRAANEQLVPGDSTIYSYEDKDGHWHDEASPGGSRPETDVEGWSSRAERDRLLTVGSGAGVGSRWSGSRSAVSEANRIGPHTVPPESRLGILGHALN